MKLLLGVLLGCCSFAAAQQPSQPCPMPTKAGLPEFSQLAQSARIAVTDTVALTVQDGRIASIRFMEDGHPINAPSISKALSAWQFDDKFTGTCSLKFVFHLIKANSNQADSVTFQQGQVDITSHFLMVSGRS